MEGSVKRGEWRVERGRDGEKEGWGEGEREQRMDE